MTATEHDIDETHCRHILAGMLSPKWRSIDSITHHTWNRQLELVGLKLVGITRSGRGKKHVGRQTVLKLTARSRLQIRPSYSYVISASLENFLHSHFDDYRKVGPLHYTVDDVAIGSKFAIISICEHDLGCYNHVDFECSANDALFVDETYEHFVDHYSHEEQ